MAFDGFRGPTGLVLKIGYVAQPLFEFAIVGFNHRWWLMVDDSTGFNVFNQKQIR